MKIPKDLETAAAVVLMHHRGVDASWNENELKMQLDMEKLQREYEQRRNDLRDKYIELRNTQVTIFAGLMAANGLDPNELGRSYALTYNGTTGEFHIQPV